MGKDHAKWSPVGTAFYRLKPEVSLLRDFAGEEALKLVSTCAAGVFDIENGKAFVKDARACTACRNCLEEFPDTRKDILLQKRKDHFIFTIESIGQMSANDLFEIALQQLLKKARAAVDLLTNEVSSLDVMDTAERAYVKAAEEGAMEVDG